MSGSNEDIGAIFGASVSDDDGGGDGNDNPIPNFLLNPDSRLVKAEMSKKSPLMFRQTKSSPPTITKLSLKNYSGMECGMLSTQDSVEAAKAVSAGLGGSSAGGGGSGGGSASPASAAAAAAASGGGTSGMED